jgi:hypothetical protein
MNNPTDSATPPNGNHGDPAAAGLRETIEAPKAAIEDAIDAGCGSLIALQASLASVDEMPGEHHREQALIRSAIDLIRALISDLQSLRSGSPMALGFVSGRQRRQVKRRD